MAPRQCSIVIILLLLLVLSPLGASVGPRHASIMKAPSRWTIMVYMADDFPPDLPWRENINQMEAANQSPGTNIIALVHPLGSNASMLLQIEHDDGTHGDAIISPRVNDSGAVIPLNGTVDMGSPNTLRSFIRFCATNFSADNLVLIMWGHAGGWIGLCPDGDHILTLPEFGQALAGATSDIGRKLDVIGIDACGEANVEMLEEIHPYAHYLVASEKNIPDEGFPYTSILNGLSSNLAQGPSTFASTMVKDYIDWSRYNSSISASIGVFDLTRMDDMETSLDSLASLGTKYDSLFHEAFNAAFVSAQNYTEPWNVDLGDLLGRLLQEQLPPDVHKAAMDTMLSYLEVRVNLGKLDLENPFDGEHTNRATGAVIYAPTSVGSDETYVYLQIATGHWYLFGRLARQVGVTNYSSQVPALKYEDKDGDGRPDSVTLTWPGQYQSNDASWFREEAGGLSYVDSTSSPGNQTTVSGEGNLTISANAINGTVSQAHVTLRVTLFGRMEIKVQMLENGRNSTQDADVRVTTENSTMDRAALSGTLRFNLSVPSQVEIGDIIHVQIVDNRSGTVLGDALAIVGVNETVVPVEVHQAPQKELPIWTPLLVASLPGLLILLFDLQLYLGDKKKRMKPSR